MKSCDIARCMIRFKLHMQIVYVCGCVVVLHAVKVTLTVNDNISISDPQDSMDDAFRVFAGLAVSRAPDGKARFTYLRLNHTFHERGMMGPFKLVNPHPSNAFEDAYQVGLDEMKKQALNEATKVCNVK